MIILYKGARGRGKTLTMVKDGYKYHQNGWKVLRNFHATFGKKIENEEILQLAKDSKITNCVLMIDEIQIFFDSRRAMKKENINFSNFIQQIRKRGITILCTTQFSNTIDTRLRQHVDIIVYPNYSKTYNVCSAIYLDLTSIENDFDNQALEIKPKSVEVVFDAKPVYKMYKTGEVII